MYVFSYSDYQEESEGDEEHADKKFQKVGLGSILTDGENSQ